MELKLSWNLKENEEWLLYGECDRDLVRFFIYSTKNGENNN